MANFVTSTNIAQQFAYLGSTTVCKRYFKNGKGGGGDRKQQVQVHWQGVDDTEQLIFALFSAIFFSFSAHLVVFVRLIYSVVRMESCHTTELSSDVLLFPQQRSFSF